MAVVIHLPGALLPFAAGQSRIALEAGPDVGAALRTLYALHPGLRDRIQNERGEIRRHVNVFVGSDNVRDLKGLATALPPDPEVHILPAVSGG
jgi:molybdopterin converting factor small subunit